MIQSSTHKMYMYPLETVNMKESRKAYPTRPTIMRIVTSAALMGATLGGIPSSAWAALSPVGSLVSSRGPQVKAVQREAAADRDSEQASSVELDDPKFLLEQIAQHSRLATTEIARTLGVSRQAVYEWQKGNSITSSNLAKLKQILTAIRSLEKEGINPTQALLKRQIGGKSILSEIASGHLPHEATKLICAAVKREQKQLASQKLSKNSLRNNDFIGQIGRPTTDG